MALAIRVRGRVQGVGFRPFVWRLAHDLGLAGDVRNDGEGVLIRAAGSESALAVLLSRLVSEPPPLAVVTSVEPRPLADALGSGFVIIESGGGPTLTEVAPDAAMCADCARELADKGDRRYRYPFITCTNCGPRLSIVRRMPYDRATTSMAPFALCPACAAEYAAPADRRFHAETTACDSCGPHVRLVRLAGAAPRGEGKVAHAPDPISAAAALIAQGDIIAVKGLGGYHLACDATNEVAVQRLRAAKRRDSKPFALMARDIAVIQRRCRVSAEEAALLACPSGPIVLLDRCNDGLPEAVAPGLAQLGFMLPTTPLHALLIEGFERPLVMTSGNLSEQPQVIDDAAVESELAGLASHALMHDREIVNRVDDSVVRLAAGAPRLLRRARGYAPAPVSLPEGLAAAPQILGLGGDLKNAFCLVKGGGAVLSQHIGDLDDVATTADLERTLTLYRDMLEAEPALIVHDLHPGYRSTQIARRMAEASGATLMAVQHHHAHIASCLAENGWTSDGPAVLGIALDGLGFGEDGTVWGGELLLADYRGFERLAALKPVAMPGGDQASREPWRNLYAQLDAAMGWERVARAHGHLDVVRALDAKPRKVLDAMTRGGINAPPASSCGRLFDAVAAALGLAFERQGYEGEAASLLESAVDAAALTDATVADGYRFAVVQRDGAAPCLLDPAPLWEAVLRDLSDATPAGIMAARFHAGLAEALAALAGELATGSGGQRRYDTVALSGGCFNNRVLLEVLHRRLAARGFTVLTQSLVPAGDGGLALGQVAIGAARALA
jgi:hydrogenase maturation protein HypF